MPTRSNPHTLTGRHLGIDLITDTYENEKKGKRSKTKTPAAHAQIISALQNNKTTPRFCPLFYIRWFAYLNRTALTSSSTSTTQQTTTCADLMVVRNTSNLILSLVCPN